MKLKTFFHLILKFSWKSTRFHTLRITYPVDADSGGEFFGFILETSSVRRDGLQKCLFGAAS